MIAIKKIKRKEVIRWKVQHWQDSESPTNVFIQNTKSDLLCGLGVSRLHTSSSILWRSPTPVCFMVTILRSDQEESANITEQKKTSK